MTLQTFEKIVLLLSCYCFLYLIKYLSINLLYQIIENIDMVGLFLK